MWESNLMKNSNPRCGGNKRRGGNWRSRRFRSPDDCVSFHLRSVMFSFISVQPFILKFLFHTPQKGSTKSLEQEKRQFKH